MSTFSENQAVAIQIVKKAIEAHGCYESWKKVVSISIDLSLGGLVFGIKGRSKNVGSKFTATTSVSEKFTVIAPFSGDSNLVGTFTPSYVKIENTHQELIAEMYNPSRLRNLWRSYLPWSKLGLLYFAGYAMSSYFTVPFSLLSCGAKLEYIGKNNIEDRVCDTIKVTYLQGYVSHSKVETFYFDEQGLLIRHDYIAWVVAPFAAGAHYSMDYFEIDGFKFAAKRRVYLRLGRFRIPLGSILWMNIEGGKINWG